MSKPTFEAHRYTGSPLVERVDAQFIRVKHGNQFIDVKWDEKRKRFEVSCDGQLVVEPCVGNLVHLDVRRF